VAGAKENLDEFDFVGIHEEFEESVARLCRYLRSPRPSDLPYVNKTKTPKAVHEVITVTTDTIKERN